MSDEYPTWSDFKADLVFDEEMQAFVHRPGCICRLGPDCPRPGKCDSSAIAAWEELTNI